MSQSKFLDSERSRLEKVLKFQLPNSFKKIGIGFFIVSFASLAILKGVIENYDLIKIILRNILLISLLLVSISRDKEEDELVKLLRSQSFALAFIFGILYAIIQPLANVLVSSTISASIQDYSSLGDFQVLIFMLLIQLFSFRFLKRMR